MWYRHFTDFLTPVYDFHHLIGFFFMFVWLVPGGFFITLSVSDMSLPGIDSFASSSSTGKQNHDMLDGTKKNRKSVFSRIMSCLRSQRANNTPMPMVNQDAASVHDHYASFNKVL